MCAYTSHSDEKLIRDHDPSTAGGPPGWLAFCIVAVFFLFGAALLISLLLLVS